MFNTEDGGNASASQSMCPLERNKQPKFRQSHYAGSTLSESVVILMEGFLAVTAVLEPHLLLRPAAAPASCSTSALPVPGDILLPMTRQEIVYPQVHSIYRYIAYKGT